MSIYQLTGNARDRSKDLGVSALRIEIKHKQAVIGEAKTDQTGQFTMRLDLAGIERPLRKNLDVQLKEFLQKMLKDRPLTTPGMKMRLERLQAQQEEQFEKQFARQFEQELNELTVDVYFQNQLLKSVKHEFKWEHDKRTGLLAITFDAKELPSKQEEPTQKGSELRVQGRVLKVDGSPLPDGIARAYDKRLRVEEQLAEVKVGRDGRYLIQTTVASDYINLLLRVFDADGTELGASPVLHHATLDEQVDIIISGEKIKLASEFEIVEQGLSPHLDGAEAASLTDEEVDFLKEQTGLDSQQITHYVLAHQLQAETKAPLETLYGALRMENPMSLTDFLVKDSDVLVQAAQKAVELNLISESGDEKTFVTQLDNYSVKKMLESPQDGVRLQLGALVKLTGMTSKQQQTFVQHALAFKGDANVFWTELSQQGVLSEKAVKEVQTTLKIGVVTAGHAPLTSVLKKQFEQGQFTALRDLGRLKQQDWLRLIDQSAGDDQADAVPDGISGDTDQDKRVTYARVLSRTVEDAFPTAVFAERLREDHQAQPLYRDLLKTLDVNPDFELGAMSIEQSIEQHPDILKGASDREKVIDGLKRARRAFLLAPRFEKYDAVKVLLDDQLDSATRVASMDQETFIQAYSVKLGGAERAQVVHKNALQRASMTQSMIASLGRHFHQNTPMVIPSHDQLLDNSLFMFGDGVDASSQKRMTKSIDEAKAKWADLFGRIDYCDCEPCRSVYSPAAYLTDLLHFLQDRPAEQKGRALELFFERRPDIGRILLNCENTNTTLPYIDLVNEVLEEQVFQLVGKTGQVARNTTLTADELRAHPEYLQPAAYEELKKAVYPWRLPFDLFAREATLYLDHIGVDRAEVMELLERESDEPTAVKIACERLGLYPIEYKLITATNGQSSQPENFWQFESKLEWVDTLKGDVPLVLKRAQLTFKECLALLRAEYVNPNAQFGIRFIGKADASESEGDLCDLGQAWFAYKGAEISGKEAEDLFADMLSRLHRFVRLQRALDWSTFELDLAIETLGTGVDPLLKTAGSSIIVKLAELVTLRKHSDLSLEELLSWFGDINTRAIPTLSESNEQQPLYHRLFLNRAVTSPINESFKLTSEGKLAGESESLTEHAETIQSVLRISAEEFTLLQNELSPTDQLSLAALSALYRHVSLARSMRITVVELLAYKQLSAHLPFASTRETIAFMGDVEEARMTRITVAEWGYWLQDTVGDSERAKMDEEITEFLTELRSGIVNLYAEERLQASGDDSEEAKDRQLLDGQQRREQWIKDRLAGLLSVDAIAGQLLVEQIKTPGASVPVYEAILASELAAAPSVPEVETDESGESDQSNVDQSDEQTEAAPSIELNINRASFSDIYDGIVRLQKAGQIVHRMEITGTYLPIVLAGGANEHWLDLGQLPTATESESASFTAGLKLQRVLNKQQQTRPRKGDRAFLALLAFMFQSGQDAVNRPQVVDELSAYFGWDSQALTKIIGPEGLDLSSEEIADIDTIERLEQIFRILSRSQLSVEGLFTLTTAEVSEEMARRARLAAKAKYDEQAWIAIAEGIRNTLREEQRQALVDYIVVRNTDISDANDLFGHLLIDVEMSSCKQTSRITQAISSAQLFVERCLMNLEEPVLSSADAKEWKQWRKRYRVWEANRQVFLYPENWIEPELRTEKSPFFKDLEDELMQGDVTTEAVERAYRGYLEKLMEVSNLEVAGLYHETENGTGTDIVHVFARTRNIPRVYFYRQRVNDSRWTAWERIDLDIEGDHLIPTVFNRRLTLFWPIFTERVVEEIPSEKASNADKMPKKYWEIKLAWSVFQDGKWSPKQTTEDVIVTGKGSHQLLKKESIYFQAQSEIIACYDGQDYLIGMFSYDFSVNQVKRHIPIANVWRLPEQVQQANFSLVMSTIAPEAPKIWTRERMGLQSHGSLILPAQNHAKEIVNQVVLKKQAPYLLLPDTKETAQFRSQGVFFVVDRENQRTFFVKPKDAYGRASILGGDLGWLPPEFVFDPGRYGNFDLIDQHDLLITGRVKFPIAPQLNADWTVGTPIAGNPAAQIPIANEPFLDGSVGGRINPQIGNQHFDFSDVGMPDRNVNRMLMMEPTTGAMSGSIANFYTLGEGYGPALMQLKGKRYTFYTFYHPYVIELNKNLIRYGVDGLLDPKVGSLLYCQQFPNQFEFSAYEPQKEFVSDCPVASDLDFSADGAYSLYNWELFFHIPFLIASRLSQHQRFEEAQKWYHAIFDPTTPLSEQEKKKSEQPGARRFWKVKPFYEEEVRRLREMLLLINRLDEAPAVTEDCSQQSLLESLAEQVKEWERNPFDPHVIANLRPIAYMKSVVMKYVDNLIAWGDNLFQQATRESIDEATHIYTLAAQILGERPHSIPAPQESVALSFKDLMDNEALDRLSNAEIEVEDLLPQLPETMGPGNASSLPLGRSLFFCVPKNDKLTGYWNTVEDRLFKIRHCLDIEGQAQQLPLFAPPIDPGMLVKAAAAGADISRAVNELHAPLPHYRYQTLHRKALELCQDVSGLGSALLAALEKKDGEQLAHLRSTHGIQLQEAGLEIRAQRIAEAKEAVAGLERYYEVVDDRRSHYTWLIEEDLNLWEKGHYKLALAAVGLRTISQFMTFGAAPIASLPDVTIGVAGTFGSPVATATTIGGQKSASTLKGFADAFNIMGSVAESGGQLAAVFGSYARRREEWKFQRDQAYRELDRIKVQILEANIRIAITERELGDAKLQIEQAKVEEDFLVQKFTNENLYNWMVTQLSNLYFQSYELAYTTAKRAEKAYQFELGRHQETFITFGHWDNLRRGLLSGERLRFELQRMDVAYLNNDRREFELNKDISLLQLDPYQLIRLRETGECEIHLPETLFDYDYPGHYMRRIKAVRMTIPCVSGPYTSVNATLTLTKGKTRLNSDPNKAEFYETVGAFHTMVTSHAQQDAGLFELNFQDARYLPFEGAGADSSWLLELPKDTNHFDFATISDVLLHVSYTSRDGGKRLREKAREERDAVLKDSGLIATFSAKQHLSAAWHEFLNDPNPQTDAHELHVELRTDGFRASSKHEVRFDRDQQVILLVKVNDSVELDELTLTIEGKPITFKAGTQSKPADGEAGQNGPPTGLNSEDKQRPQEALTGIKNIFMGEVSASEINPADWTITIRDQDIPDALKATDEQGARNGLDRTLFEDIWIVCHYTLEARA
ncbi:hypothetical protein BEP19_02230 [Ammoniphilus oxalaticus]|uniref:Virulence plasmid A protein n=1 Tax=Ammoniphilus oxalaticus TaxID=66863 RepID=A0A419SNI2_9BACL|nr:neuraminidase-like domain-containing protein [Ammoniphilus oxalaticus]RKD25779.1 hypothetical protein BEP19_02230 [Ammoniphilus oxalaticus]